MRKEYLNIITYFYISFRHLLNLHLLEAKAYFIGGLWRSVEWLSFPLAKKRVACNYCGWNGPKFKTFVASTVLRHNALCPRCLSLERHREFLALFSTITKHFHADSLSILDIAPTLAFSNYCQGKKNIEYLSVDLQSQFAMRHMNLENLLLESDQYNIVVCYHVLDYLTNDVKGMSEIHRVLAPEGITITQEGVDFQAEKTTEWQKAFPENEYRIRQYGLDFFDKWKSVGFEYLLVQGHGLSSPVMISSKTENSSALRSLETLLRHANYHVLTSPRAIPS